MIRTGLVFYLIILFIIITISFFTAQTQFRMILVFFLGLILLSQASYTADKHSTRVVWKEKDKKTLQSNFFFLCTKSNHEIFETFRGCVF